MQMFNVANGNDPATKGGNPGDKENNHNKKGQDRDDEEESEDSVVNEWLAKNATDPGKSKRLLERSNALRAAKRKRSNLEALRKAEADSSEESDRSGQEKPLYIPPQKKRRIRKDGEEQQKKVMKQKVALQKSKRVELKEPEGDSQSDEDDDMAEVEESDEDFYRRIPKKKAKKKLAPRNRRARGQDPLFHPTEFEYDSDGNPVIKLRKTGSSRYVELEDDRVNAGMQETGTIDNTLLFV